MTEKRAQMTEKIAPITATRMMTIMFQEYVFAPTIFFEKLQGCQKIILQSKEPGNERFRMGSDSRKKIMKKYWITEKLELGTPRIKKCYDILRISY